MSDAEIIPLDPSRRRTPGRRPRLKAAEQTPAGLSPIAAWPSYLLALQAKDTAETTIDVYHYTVRVFSAWLVEQGACQCWQAGEDEAAPCPAGADPDTVDLARAPGIEHITTAQIRAFLIHQRRKNSAGDAHKHFRALRTFFNWLIKEGEREAPSPIDPDDEPKVTKKVRRMVTDDEVRALLRVCKGDAHDDRRDTAIILSLYDNGARVAGYAGLRYTPNDQKTNDVWLSRFLLRIVLKGGDEHLAPVGKRTAAAIDRYIRARARHKYAYLPALWLGKKGRLGKSGIQQMLARRAEEAGVGWRIGPHNFRGAAADRILSAGGDPLDVMRIGGWKSLRMVQHYTEANADSRAQRSHARLSPSDRL